MNRSQRRVSTEGQGAQHKCYRRDKTGHFAECWSKDLECKKWGKKGHIEQACKSKFPCALDGKPVHMEIDKGSAVSLVSDNVYTKVSQQLPLQPYPENLHQPTKGFIDVTILVDGQQLRYHCMWLKEISHLSLAAHGLRKSYGTGLQSAGCAKVTPD